MQVFFSMGADGFDRLNVVWLSVAWLCAAYLIGFGAVCLARPAAAARFLDGHAATAQLNRIEAAARLLAGLGLIGASPDMRFGVLFFWFGTVLAATAIPMMFAYRLHQRFAAWSVPPAKRALPLLGTAALLLGLFVAWALL